MTNKPLREPASGPGQPWCPHLWSRNPLKRLPLDLEHPRRKPLYPRILRAALLWGQQKEPATIRRSWRAQVHLRLHGALGPPRSQGPAEGHLGPRLFSGFWRVRRYFLCKPLSASLSGAPNTNATTMKASLPCPKSEVLPGTEERSLTQMSSLAASEPLRSARLLPDCSLGTSLTTRTHQRPLGWGCPCRVCQRRELREDTEGRSGEGARRPGLSRHQLV